MRVSPVLICVQSNQNLLTMHSIMRLVILIKRILIKNKRCLEILRLIFAGKTKNHLRISEGHLDRIVKNHEAQV